MEANGSKVTTEEYYRKYYGGHLGHGDRNPAVGVRAGVRRSNFLSQGARSDWGC